MKLGALLTVLRSLGKGNGRLEDKWSLSRQHNTGKSTESEASESQAANTVMQKISRSKLQLQLLPWIIVMILMMVTETKRSITY